MRIADMNWMQVRDHVEGLRRQGAEHLIAILPIGSTEQHAYLSVAVDCILAERVSVEAAAPLRLPVFPTLNYGITPNFVDFPGTVSLRVSTMCALLEDVLDGIARAGFDRIVIVNGHGGNGPAHGAVLQWLDRHREAQVKWHNWWNAPRTWAAVERIDPLASHASWMENFSWTRTDDPRQPDARKPMVDLARLVRLDPGRKKTLLGDGNFGGHYARSDEQMASLWQVAVEETRAVFSEGWD